MDENKVESIEVEVGLKYADRIISVVEEKDELKRSIENILMFIFNAKNGVKADSIKSKDDMASMVMRELYNNFDLVKQFK